VDPVSACSWFLAYLRYRGTLHWCAKLAREFAKLRGENIALRNELLGLMWAPQLRLLAEYEAARTAGEIAGEGRPKTVPDGNSLPSTRELNLSRKDLSLARKVAKAGGIDFADAAIAACTESQVEATSALLLRTAAKLLNQKDLDELGAADTPDGTFDVIVVDPPWPMRKIERDVCPRHQGHRGAPDRRDPGDPGPLRGVVHNLNRLVRLGHAV
jgi:hypothetical protein